METISPLTLLQVGHLAFGAGCRKDLPAYLQRHQTRSVLLITNSFIRSLADPVKEALEAAGMSVTVIEDAPPEPDVATFERLRQRAQESHADTVVGLGGGSVLDIAKLIAAMADNPQPVKEAFGIGNLKGRNKRLVCLPTTSGTGSEVSPNAILLDESEHLKKGVVSPWLVPDAAFVDPELTLSLPPALTATTGIDALVHCIEAYANLHAHPMVDIYALEGVRLIGANIRRAFEQGDDLAARTAVSLGSLYGGMCLGPVNTAAVHALAYPLGGEFHIAHGLSNAFLLPHVLRFNLPAAPKRYADIARALGVEDQGSDAATAEAGIVALEELCAACQIPRRLSEIGVPADAIPRMAESAMTVTRLLRNNPRPLTVEDAAMIYQKAME
ncbi:MAG: iron-containing alcohol dehydrogenase [Verrucomicrobiota bacterium JB022]|nr:iron-containing alcohol dehydrogenase [Verrucomicrobiota bacterium JB022]